MRHSKATRYVILIAFAILAPAILSGIIPRAHAVTAYGLGTIPFLGQEGTTYTIVFTVYGATGNTQYQFRFVIKDPAAKLHFSNLQNYTTSSGQTQFTIPVFYYPTSSFPGPNDLVGQYFLNATQTLPVATPNVASAYFLVFLTDKYEYQRTETVNVHATGYNISEPVTVKIATGSTPSTTVFTQSTTASLSGVVNANWHIPRNATIDPNGYIVTVAGTTTVKTPADIQGFNIKRAVMSVSALNSPKSSYQRTETMSFSFQPTYPDGTLASTGVALLTLARPGGGNAILTTVYSSNSQTFNATYKTSANNVTGTWTATLAVDAYADSWGNSGPASTLTNTPQLTPATFAIAVTATTYVPIGQQVRFNATISYPDGTLLSSGNVKSYLIYTGTPTVTESVQVTYDSGHQHWVGSYTPKATDPGGLWSLIVNATDSPTPPNSGTASTAVTLQDRPPVASFTPSQTSAPTGTSITFNGTASYDPDGTLTGYSWNFGDGYAGNGAVVSHAFSPAAVYTVTLTVTDNGGLTNSTSVQVTITDRPPTVTFTTSPLTANTGQTITLTITSSDPDGTVSSTLVAWGDGYSDLLSGPASTDSHSYASTGSSTSHVFTITVTVTDNSASTGFSSSQVTITDRPPSVSFSPSSTNIVTGQNVTLTITATDPDGSITSKTVDWGDGTIDTLSAAATSDTHNYASTGSMPTKTITIKVNATDNSGSIGSYSAQITLTDRPPSVSTVASPSTMQTGQTATVSITSSDPDGTIIATRIDWGDGSIDALTGGPTRDTHIYTSTGSSISKTYVITLNVTDNSGSKSSYYTQITVSDRPPTVTVPVNLATTLAGQAVTVPITSGDSDGTIASTRIDWGDGTVDNLGNVASDSHRYTLNGSASKNYTITVTVTDNSGQTNTASSNVLIQPASNNTSNGNLSLPLYYFGILAAAIAAVLAGGFLAFRRHRVTHARLKIDLEAVKSEAGRIENQEFFQSVKDQLKKENDGQ